jgi:hypothetical protein
VILDAFYFIIIRIREVKNQCPKCKSTKTRTFKSKLAEYRWCYSCAGMTTIKKEKKGDEK